MVIFIIITSGLIILSIGIILGFFITRLVLNNAGTTLLLEAEERSREIIVRAKDQVEKERINRLKSVSEEWLKKKRAFYQESQIETNQLRKLQKRLNTKEEDLDKKQNLLYKREKHIESLEKDLQEKDQAIGNLQAELEKSIEIQNDRLSQISKVEQEEAKAMLMENLISSAKLDSKSTIEKIREETIQTSEKEASKILLNAMEKLSSNQFSDNAMIFVTLSSDEIKGKIIGREGRNIKAFQNITGVDLIIDDTPETVMISSFDPIRRETAKLTLERLLVDGIIHPALIEKEYNAVIENFDNHVLEIGEEAAIAVDVKLLDPAAIKKIGLMRYTSTYGQNLLDHSKETAQIAGVLATEVKADTKIARRAALLHDIGKMVKNPVLPHALEGMNFMSQFNETPQVLNAIGAHHGDIKKTSIISELVSFANILSASRPKARGAVFEDGEIKRLESLEEIARSFPGVQKSYAIDAGREIRVIVSSKDVSDEEVETLAKELSDKLSTAAKFSGKIKVSVVRETRYIVNAEAKTSPITA